MSMDSVETISTDVAIIGAGATGLAAALTAAEGGASVMVFEKQRSLGGTSNFFEGTFAVESEMQRKQYITYSRDEAFKAIMEYSHWRVNPRLVRAIVNESAATIAWLQQQGVEFTEATINLPNAPRTYHLIKGDGETVIKALATRAREKGVDIRPAAPVKKILRQGEKIVGLVAEIEEKEIQITASTAVVASGGYINNKDWVKKYAGFELGVNLMPFGNVDKMGDGIRMAWEVAADQEGMGVLEMLRLGPLGPETMNRGNLMCAAAQPALWVNAQGERFCDESIAFSETSEGNASARIKEGYSYTLFDEAIKEIWTTDGIAKNLSKYNPPGTRLTNLDKEMSDAMTKESKEVFAAGSIEELAGKIGIEITALKTTVDEYNRHCEKGHDDLFAKDPQYLRPLKRPNFYALRLYTVCIGTLGGIKINHQMEALDKNGKVIPGLYAGGYDAGGMWGDSYPIQTSSGLCSAFALNSGRIAGRNALKYIGK
jgi:fumarate reductase flavoprotein subunit